MNKTTISKCTTDDLEEYQALATKTFYEAYEKGTDKADLEKYIDEHFSISAVAEELTDPENAIFFLKDDGENIVGYIKLRRNDAQKLFGKEKVVALQRIYVAKEFQNSGYGQQLLDYAEAFGRDEQFEWIWLCVWNENDGAIRFYEKSGWEKFGEIDFKFGDTVYQDPVFRKRL